MQGSNHDQGLMAPSVDGSALVDEPGRTEGMTVARATEETWGERRARLRAKRLSREATATPQDSTSPATSPQSAATAAIGAPTNITPTPVSADARSHKAPTKTAEE